MEKICNERYELQKIIENLDKIMTEIGLDLNYGESKNEESTLVALKTEKENRKPTDEMGRRLLNTQKEKLNANRP